MTPLPAHSQVPRTEFERRIFQDAPQAQRSIDLAALTLNVGYHCDLTCALCHHRCSPSRTETMPRGVMLNALTFAAEVHPDRIEVTGGEPVLWPHLREFLQLARGAAAHVRVHTNLTALLGAEGPDALRSLAENRTELLVSLPEMLEDRTVIECMQTLVQLAAAGYGDPSRGAIPLDIAYSPMAGSLPRPHDELEREYRDALSVHRIGFRSLVSIVHVPLGGFADWLDESGRRDRYVAKLHKAYDPATADDLPCRHGLEIGWDGTLWDCDYHLAAEQPLAEQPRQVGDYVSSPVGQMSLATRRIHFAEHCFACTARREVPDEEDSDEA